MKKVLLLTLCIFFICNSVDLFSESKFEYDQGEHEIQTGLFSRLKGPRGDRGPRGPRGVQGLPGLPGSTGERGLKGPTGAIGARGLQGMLGATGATGSTGATGPAGEVGQIGATGATGPAGEVGQIGATGATGPAGEMGQIGATGAQGMTGATGSDGPTGATGVLSSSYAYAYTAGKQTGVTSGTIIRLNNINLQSGGYSLDAGGGLVIPESGVFLLNYSVSVSFAGGVVGILLNGNPLPLSKFGTNVAGTVVTGTLIRNLNQGDVLALYNGGIIAYNAQKSPSEIDAVTTFSIVKIAN